MITGAPGNSGGRPILVAGAQRSASTSLARWLGRHPAIHASRDELYEFDFCYRPEIADRALRRLDRQRRRAGKPVLLLKRPQLLHFAVAAQRAIDHLGEIPLVVVSLRAPLERTVSAARFYQRLGHLPLAPLPDIIETALRHHRAGYQSPYAELIGFSCYSAGIRWWDERTDTVVLADATLHADPGTLLSSIARVHADVDTADLGPLPRSNPSTRHPARLRVTAAAGRLRMVRDGDRRGIRAGLAWRLVTSPLVGFDRVLARVVAEPAPDELPDALARRLREVFDADTEQLPEPVRAGLPTGWLPEVA